MFTIRPVQPGQQMFRSVTIDICARDYEKFAKCHVLGILTIYRSSKKTTSVNIPFCAL
jgi:hypothetical protein